MVQESNESAQPILPGVSEEGNIPPKQEDEAPELKNKMPSGKLKNKPRVPSDKPFDPQAYENDLLNRTPDNQLKQGVLGETSRPKGGFGERKEKKKWPEDY
jgi:hypothetical protein